MEWHLALEDLYFQMHRIHSEWELHVPLAESECGKKFERMSAVVMGISKTGIAWSDSIAEAIVLMQVKKTGSLLRVSLLLKQKYARQTNGTYYKYFLRWIFRSILHNKYMLNIFKPLPLCAVECLCCFYAAFSSAEIVCPEDLRQLWHVQEKKNAVI